MSYEKKLKLPQWQRRRLEIMKRDEFKCVECGTDEKELQVHHEKYIKGNEPWEYPDELLVTLCRDCHKAKHTPEPATLSENPVIVKLSELALPMVLEFYRDEISKETLLKRINLLQGHSRNILRGFVLALKSDTLRELSHVDGHFYIKKCMEFTEVKQRFIKQHELKGVFI